MTTNKLPIYLGIAYATLLFVLQIVIAFPMIGHAIYLADQLDQTGAFFQLIEGHWEFFYGPLMSGTNPSAHCLGPLGALLFGLPTLLGANPDQLHGMFIVLVSLAVVILFWEVFQQSPSLAYIWSAVILTMPSLWWHHSLLWVNVFLLPITCIEIALFLRLLRQPSWSGWLRLLAIFILGMHIHSSASIGIALVGLGVPIVFLAKKSPHLTRLQAAITTSLLAFAILPYIIAEIYTGGANLRAIFYNIVMFSAKPDHHEGMASALSATAGLWNTLGFVPYLNQLIGDHRIIPVLIGITCAVSIAAAIRKIFSQKTSLNLFNYLWLLWGSVFIVQFIFFYVMNRPLLSLHYTTFLIPYYGFPWAFIAITCLSVFPKKEMLVLMASCCLIFTSVTWLPRITETSETWNFRNIQSSMISICKEFGSINTYEGYPFKTYDENFLPLLQFIGDRYTSNCKFSKNSKYLLVPSLQRTQLPTSVEKDQKIYDLMRVMHPGIGIYNESKEVPKGGVGFYGWEEWGGDKPFKVRWTGGRASVPLENIDLKKIQILCSHPDIEQNPVVVTVLIDDKPVWKKEVKDKMWKKIKFNPDSPIDGKVVTFQVSRTWNPKGMGISADGRDLGVAVK